MQSCFSLMIGLKHHHPLPFDAAVIKQRKFSWIASNDSKPGREQNGSLTVHASNDWSDHNLEEHPENIKKILLQETCDVINIKKEAIQHLDLHQWRYANCKPQSTPPYWFSENEQLGMCGDWCIQGRIESAFTSAHKLAQNWMALYA